MTENPEDVQNALVEDIIAASNSQEGKVLAIMASLEEKREYLPHCMTIGEESDRQLVLWFPVQHQSTRGIDFIGQPPFGRVTVTYDGYLVLSRLGPRRVSLVDDFEVEFDSNGRGAYGEPIIRGSSDLERLQEWVGRCKGSAQSHSETTRRALREMMINGGYAPDPDKLFVWDRRLGTYVAREGAPAVDGGYYFKTYPNFTSHPKRISEQRFREMRIAHELATYLHPGQLGQFIETTDTADNTTSTHSLPYDMEIVRLTKPDLVEGFVRANLAYCLIDRRN